MGGRGQADLVLGVAVHQPHPRHAVLQRAKGPGRAPRDLRATFRGRHDRLRPVIDSEFPLDRAAEAHRRIESSDHIGKIVLKVGG